MAENQTKGYLLPIVIALLGFFMALLDTTIVNVSLPAITADLNTDLSQSSWVVDAYTLAFGVFLLTAARLADQFGRKRLFQIGLVLFTLASLLCGLSTSLEALIVFRVLQGLGAAIIVPVVIPLVASHLPTDKMAKVTALFGAMAGLASALGPALGGSLTESLNWQWIFYLNLPIGLLAVVLAHLFVKESRDPTASRRIDWGGIATLSIALFALIYSLLKVGENGWDSPITLSLLAVAVAGLLAFFLIERRVREPMLPLRLFRDFRFTAGNLAFFLFGIGHMAVLLLLSFLLVDVQGWNPTRAGLVISAMAVCSIFVSPVTGVLVNKRGTKWFGLAGFLTFGIGLYLLGGLTADSGALDIIWRMAVLGVGISLIMPSLSLALILQVPEDKIGMSSGISNTARTIGMALGVAILVALLSHYNEEGIREAAAEAASLVQQSDLPADDRQELLQGIEGWAFGGQVQADDDWSTRLEEVRETHLTRSAGTVFQWLSVFLFLGAVFAWRNGIASAEFRELVRSKPFGSSDRAAVASE